MTGDTTVERQPGWATTMVHSVAGGWNRVGTQIKFNARSIREMGIAVVRYRTEILRLIARGASNKEIGRELGIAETTVKIHVQHLLRKLKLSSRVQAAVFASEHRLN